jgi:hypothetical protein
MHPNKTLLLKLLLEIAALQLQVDGFVFCQVLPPVLETVWIIEALNVFFTVSAFVLSLHMLHKHSSNSGCGDHPLVLGPHIESHSRCLDLSGTVGVWGSSTCGEPSH